MAGNRNRGKISTKGLIAFRNLFFKELKKKESKREAAGKYKDLSDRDEAKKRREDREADLESAFEQVAVIPCREHGIELKSKFGQQQVENYKFYFLAAVKRDQVEKSIFLSKSRIPNCDLANEFDSSISVLCDTCKTSDPSRFSKKSNSPDGRAMCKLCKASMLKDSADHFNVEDGQEEIEEGSNLAMSRFREHLKVCGIKMEEVIKHKKLIEKLENETKAEALNCKGDPYELESDEVY
eukprot:NODE_65_length_23997_cov_0.327601.p11 type:complete len:239 gc:universal NODE_65_length_23997_cov_0.327601:11606-10890(-)